MKNKLKINLQLNRNYFDQIKNAFLQSELKEKIVCLLAHGSSLYYSVADNIHKDIDLELILKEAKKDNYTIIKNILDSVNIKIECQLRYKDEICGNGMIQRSGYKLFMLFAYENAHCLIGDNIYKNLAQKISDEKIKQSILISAQIAFKDIRKSFFANQCGYIVNKNIIRMFVCICMYENILDYRKIGTAEFFQQESAGFIELIIKRYEKYLSLADIKILRRFVKYYEEEKIFPDIFLVVKKISDIFGKKH